MGTRDGNEKAAFVCGWKRGRREAVGCMEMQEDSPGEEEGSSDTDWEMSDGGETLVPGQVWERHLIPAFPMASRTLVPNFCCGPAMLLSLESVHWLQDGERCLYPSVLFFFFFNELARGNYVQPKRNLRRILYMFKLGCLCFWCFYPESISFFKLHKVKSSSHFLCGFCCCFYSSNSHLYLEIISLPVFFVLFLFCFSLLFFLYFPTILMWFHFFTLKSQIGLGFTLV